MLHIKSSTNHMRINIVCVGKIKEKYLKLGIDEFKKRLSKYCKLEIIELEDEKAPENLSDKEMLMIKEKEAAVRSFSIPVILCAVPSDL